MGRGQLIFGNHLGCILGTLAANHAVRNMQIFVKLLSGVTTNIDVEPDETIESVCRKVQDREGFEPKLMLGAKPLYSHPERTLDEWGIEKEARQG